MIGRRSFMKNAATGLAGVAAAAKVPMKEVFRTMEDTGFAEEATARYKITTPPANILKLKEFPSFGKRVAMMLADRALRDEIESELFQYYRGVFAVEADIEVHKSWSPTFKQLEQRKRLVKRELARFQTLDNHYDASYPTATIEKIWNRAMSLFGF